MRFDNIADTVGRTPLVRINRLTLPRSATLYAKLESFNPGGSVKDRIGVSMIEAAEKDGRLRPGWILPAAAVQQPGQPGGSSSYYCRGDHQRPGRFAP